MGALIVIGRGSVVGLLGVVLLGLALGAWRGGTVADGIADYQQLYDHKVVLQVTASEDAVYATGGQWTFVAGEVITESGEKLPGKLGIKGMGPMAIYQDDVLLVQGKLREGIGAYQGFMSYAQLEVIEHNPSWITELRRNFGAGMLSALPEPMASFAMGLLIGQRASLPEETKDHLKMVGLTHIIAVSGANLTIILEASRKLLGKSSKRLAYGFSLGLMLVFVFMTGGSASIVRAAYVSAFSMAAAYYGRRMRPLLIISMVAAITAFIDPVYIWADASWYLSFLAFFGVLMVSPLLQSRLPILFQRNILLAVALESICAEIMSLPYILYTFGELSFVGVLANMLVVIMIPLAMLLSLVAGLAGMFLFPICGWLAWPARYILTYMLDMAHVLADLPGIYREGVWLSLTGVVIIYGSIAGLVWLLSFKDRAKSAIITDNTAFEPQRILGRMS